MEMHMGKDVYGDKFNTPIGRVSYPHVFKKAKGMKDKEGKFELTLLIPKSTDITELRKKVDAVGIEAFGSGPWTSISKKKPAIKDGDEWAEEKKAEGKDAEVYRGNWYIKARSSKRPAVVGPSRQLLDESDDVFYGGCYAIANVTPGSYDADGSKGVTLYLNAVQKVKDGERFGSGTVNPDDVFESFEEDAAESDGGF